MDFGGTPASCVMGRFLLFLLLLLSLSGRASPRLALGLLAGDERELGEDERFMEDFVLGARVGERGSMVTSRMSVRGET
jgi:hypothetical protein